MVRMAARDITSGLAMGQWRKTHCRDGLASATTITEIKLGREPLHGNAVHERAQMLAPEPVPTSQESVERPRVAGPAHEHRRRMQGGNQHLRKGRSPGAIRPHSAA